MIVAFTRAAAADLDEILAYTSANFPDRMGVLEARLKFVIDRIAQWPASGRAVEGRDSQGRSAASLSIQDILSRA